MPTWNTAFNAYPAGTNLPSVLDDAIRDTRLATEERVIKEHIMNLSSGLTAEDGWHRSGSAKVYYQASAPTNRPDGATALTSDDYGRLWVDSDTDYPYIYKSGGFKLLEDPLGSARVYYQTSAPTTRPNGTALSSADEGRLWVKSADAGFGGLYLYDTSFRLLSPRISYEVIDMATGSVGDNYLYEATELGTETERLLIFHAYGHQSASGAGDYYLSADVGNHYTVISGIAQNSATSGTESTTANMAKGKAGYSYSGTTNGSLLFSIPANNYWSATYMIWLV